VTTPDSPDSFLNRTRITDLNPSDFNRMQGVNPDVDRFMREQQNAYNRNQQQNFILTADLPDLNNPVQSPNSPRQSLPEGFIVDPNHRPGSTSYYRRGFDPTTFDRYTRPPTAPPAPATPANNFSPPPPATPPSTPRTNGISGGGNAGGGASTSPPSTGSPREATATAAPPGARPSNPNGAVATGNPGGGYVSTGGAAIRKAAPAGGAAAGVATFALDLVNGRNPVDALGHSAAVAAGGVVGTVVCSQFGPLAAMVCGSVGGTLGGALYDKFFHPSPATIPGDPIQGPAPFYGGQSPGVLYRIYTQGTDKSQSQQEGSGVYVWGPISRIFLEVTSPPEPSTPDYMVRRFYAWARNGAGQPLLYQLAGASGSASIIKNYNWRVTRIVRDDGKPDTGGDVATRLPISTDNRTSESQSHPTNNSAPPRGTPAAGQNPAPNNYGIGGTQSREGGNARGDAPNFPRHAAPAGTPHPDAFPYPLIISPLPPGLANSGSPQSQGAPNNSTNGSPVLGQPITVNAADGSVSFTTPGHTSGNNPAVNAVDLSYPRAFPEANAPLEYPRAFPEATFNPPLSTTGFLSSPNLNNLVSSGTPQPIQAQPTPTATNPIPPLQSAPGTGTQTTTQPTTAGSIGATGTQAGAGLPSTGTQPTTAGSTGATGTQTGTGSPSTGAQTGTQTGTTTPASPAATQADLQQMRTELETIITQVGLPLVGITQLLNPIPQIANNTTPEALKNAAANGVCSTLKPGGCMTGLTNNAERAANNSTSNNNLLNQILNILRAANETLLPFIWQRVQTIDTKLGAQIPGGISSFVQTAFRATRIDKILNALTLITTLHNAAMLSRNLGQTLGELTSQALATIGIKDETGSPLDINGEIGKQVNNLMSAILGADTWAGTKLAWNKANAILASASQIVYTVRSIFDSGREVTEWIANNTGKIGNALKRFRVVGENAYPHMAENVNHQNAWMLKVQRYRENVDSLDDAASSLQGVLGEVQNIQQEAQELKEQKERFDKAIQEAQPKTVPDNKPMQEKAAAAKAVSVAPANAADVFRGEGESPNA